jgi:AraC-like DNA-binding protein
LLQPGDLTIYDATRPHRLIFSQDFQKLILQLPRKSLKDRIAGIERCTALRIPGSDGVGGVTAGFLRAFAANAKQLERDQLAKLAEQALDLLAMAVGSVRPIGACYSHSRSLSLCRVKAFVDQHIADPTLDTATVANLVGLSSRYINKLLEDEDTSLLRYVWKRRLEYCRNDLADPTHAWHRVSEIALRWGFNDLSHFSRAFRKQFGMSPREFRQTKHDVKRLPDSFGARLKARKSRHASSP